MGVLYYWKKGMKEPYKISTDIDKGSFGFSADCREALFIQNFDRVNMQGDLQAKSLKHLNEEKKHIDTGVCSSFGTDVKTDAYIYAKNFSLDDKTYEIYAKDKKDKILRLGERTNKPPVLQKNGRIIAYGNETENTYNLYNIKVSDGSKEKLASDIKNIEYISSGGELIIYSKVYDEKIADYFVYMRGKQPQKIASNVSVDYKTVKAAQQFAVSKDFSKCAYIADFNEEKSGGALYTCALKGRNAAKAVKAAEDVYFCSYSDNGKFVFGKDYSKSRQVLDVWALSGEKISAVCEDVDPELLAVSGSGENIYYIADYKVSGDFGNLMKMSLKGKKEQLESEVFAFDTGEIGDILIYKNINIENGGSFDFYMLKGGKGKLLEIDTEINNVFLMQR